MNWPWRSDPERSSSIQHVLRSRNATLPVSLFGLVGLVARPPTPPANPAALPAASTTTVKGAQSRTWPLSCGASDLRLGMVAPCCPAEEAILGAVKTRLPDAVPLHPTARAARPRRRCQRHGDPGAPPPAHGAAPPGALLHLAISSSTSSTEIPERHEWPSQSTALRSSYRPPYGKKLHPETRHPCPSPRCNSAPSTSRLNPTHAAWPLDKVPGNAETWGSPSSTRGGRGVLVFLSTIGSPGMDLST